MSTIISRYEKNISLQLGQMKVDALGRLLLARIQDLLRTRPDVTPEYFFRAIGRPTASWRSEFLAAKRTTNDLRLVLKIAKFFGVPCGYLLGESHAPDDPQLLSLQGLWPDLGPHERETLLLMATRFRGSAGGGSHGPPGNDQEGPSGHNASAGNAPQKRKPR